MALCTDPQVVPDLSRRLSSLRKGLSGSCSLPKVGFYCRLGSMETSEQEKKMYRWHVQVKTLDHYGQRYTSTTPCEFIAADRADVTQQMRVAFNATYDDFRKFWSHTWFLDRMEAV